MSVFSALYTARTGMQVYEQALGVIGDNIANLNTIAYKSSRGVFSDIFYGTLLSGNAQIGIGSQMLTVQRNTNQGVLLGTNVSTDLSVKGAGFFIVNGEGPSGTGQYFTRAGQMEIDADGFLVNPAGLRVQGYSADSQGNIMPALGDIEIGNKSSAPKATQEISFNLNLSADEPVGPGFDVLDPAFTSQFSTSVTVYDSLGKAHQADVYFEKSAANEWTYHVTVDDGELQGGTGGSLSEIATGTLTFNADGQLDSHVQVGGTVNFADAETQSFLFDFGPTISTGGDGQATTQHSGQSAVEVVDQDGFGSGRLQFLVFEDDGTVVGTFTNGRVLPVGQIATALFLSPGNLDGVGDNLFRASTESGSAAIGAPASGGRGQVFSGALEQSNVDLTREFTEMIVTQRAFQASSRTISTSDEMLAEVVNLKR